MAPNMGLVLGRVARLMDARFGAAAGADALVLEPWPQSTDWTPEEQAQQAARTWAEWSGWVSGPTLWLYAPASRWEQAVGLFPNLQHAAGLFVPDATAWEACTTWLAQGHHLPEACGLALGYLGPAGVDAPWDRGIRPTWMVAARDPNAEGEPMRPQVASVGPEHPPVYREVDPQQPVTAPDPSYAGLYWEGGLHTEGDYAQWQSWLDALEQRN